MNPCSFSCSFTLIMRCPLVCVISFIVFLFWLYYIWINWFSYGLYYMLGNASEIIYNLINI